MNPKTHKASKSGNTERRDSTLFGTAKKNTIATYSKNRPVQVAKKYHFLTPDTPEDWIPPSNEANSKQGTNKKGSMPQNTPSARRGSSLALRNISNIPLKKTLGATPCVPNQQSSQSNRRLTPSSFLPSKLSSSDEKECKLYRTELQSSKKTSLKKSKVLVSTTVYSSKSMSCCSVCGGVACSNGHSLSTIKSMSLCHSLTGGDILDDLSLDMGLNDESQVSQPHNSTLVEEDCNVELKDIIPQDLSAIMEEPVDEEQPKPPKKSRVDTEIHQLLGVEEASSAACCPRCSTPTDPEKIQPLNSAVADVSTITANEKNCVIPVENKPTDLKKTACRESNTDEPDVTPEAVSNKECTGATVEPKQKRKLAYCMDMDKVPDCCLLDIINNKKQPVKLLFKQDKNSSHHWTSLPVDVLIHWPCSI